jgi:predicted PurR-regulated permease PerM
VAERRRYADMAVLAGFLLAVRLGLWVAGPFVVGALLAAAAEPQVALLTGRLRLPRGLAVALVLAVWAGVALWLGAEVGSHIVQEAAALLARVPHGAAGLRDLVLRALARLTSAGALPPALSQAARAELATGAALLSRAAVAGLGALSAVPSALGGAVVSLAAAFLVGAGGPIGPRVRPVLAGIPLGETVDRVGTAAARAAYQLVRAELILAAGSGVACALLLLLLGSPYPLLLGAVAGALDLIPYAGPAVLLLPWAAFLAVTGHLTGALEAAGGWACLAGLRALLELHLVGQGVGLSALGVLFSLYVGGRFFGPVGILAGPVAAAAVLAVWRQPADAAPGRGEAARPRPRRPAVVWRARFAAAPRRDAGGGYGNQASVMRGPHGRWRDGRR